MCLALFFVPVSFFIFNILKNKKWKIEKLSFKGAEAKISNYDKNDETIFDKDIKEIVYLIYNSNCRTIIIEDLDRNNNIQIFTKLRELNFLIDKHIYNRFAHKYRFKIIQKIRRKVLKTNENKKENKLIFRILSFLELVLFLKKSKNIKFLYLTKNSLFSSEERVKFFDFIISIIPFVDYMSSRNILSTLGEENQYKEIKNTDELLNTKTIDIFSKYIKEARILNNILNDFQIYKNILYETKDIVNLDKLFVTMVLKIYCPKILNYYFKKKVSYMNCH